ncbi:membrane protein [Arthrobacter phage Mufasa8]|uniref:Uncharacterized protein n=1 Tax=Arthrobacter phage Mufasa8 TaxID=2656526 RepID=A0A649VML2_9CAUD|nr:holin [Arthrobacter phage Mufasa8]QGJ93471.1 membrane protein [Arthrobacter phage Mufasa8]
MADLLAGLTDQFPILATIGAVLAAVGYLVTKIKKGWKAASPWVKKLTHLVNDLVGEEARPGVEARPGLMVRMQTSEKAAQATDKALAEIRATQMDHHEVLAELRPNHGGSIKDRIRDLHAEGIDSKARLDVIEKTFLAHIASCTPPAVVATATATT